MTYFLLPLIDLLNIFRDGKHPDARKITFHTSLELPLIEQSKKLSQTMFQTLRRLNFILLDGIQSEHVLIYDIFHFTLFYELLHGIYDVIYVFH